MQKKLIALAIAGLSSTAFAQTNVTIQGLFDTGVTSFKSQTGGVSTTSSTWGSASNSATTNLTFIVNEDLGGGLKAGLWLETDPTAGTSNTTGFWNSQNYLWLGGNFGTVKLGFFNNSALTAALAAQPFGVGMGGGYSGAFGRLDGAGVIGAPTAAAYGGAGARDIRANNAVAYVTPTFSGFDAALIYKQKNTGAGTTAGDSDGQTQLGLKYGNGPFNIAYAHSIVAGGDQSGQFLNSKVKHNLLGANYTFGAVTLYGGWTSSKHSTATTADSKSWNVALKWQATSNIALMANVLRVNDSRTNNQDRKLNALGLDYGMSKRTTAYLRAEDGDNDTATGAAGKFSRYAAGIRHAF